MNFELQIANCELISKLRKEVWFSPIRNLQSEIRNG
jgi:hypothetical protein